MQRGMAATALAALLTAVPGAALAQGPMAGHDMGAMKEIPAPDKLPPPLKMAGLGNSHITITGSPEAQMWFDQGLNLLHDFWDYESARAFQQAVRVDPKCAMCSWGLYQALTFRGGSDNVYADQALDSAVRLKDHASKAEKLYIEASVAARDAQKAAGEGRANDAAEIAVWRRLVKENPKDLQAKVFLASSLRNGYDETGEPKKGTQEAITLLQEVLKTAPNDSAANHYWIHAMEPSSHPERALGSAELLASLSPASGHMVHMPGHIFYRVGNYQQAEHWFAASTQVDETYMQTQHVDVDDDWNYIHNLMYGIANLMEEGKLTEATTLSAKVPGGRGVLSPTLYTGSPRDGISRLSPTLPIALRTSDWAAISTMLEGAKPDAKLANLNFLAGALQDFSKGMQSVQADNLAEAQAASSRLDAELWRVSQKMKDMPKEKKEPSKAPMMTPVMPDALPQPLLSNLSIMSLELRAAILVQQQKLPEAKALFADAALEEKKLGYREPPSYIRPVGEAEGAALLRTKDYAGAHKAYEAALVERPKSGFPLYGMARSSEGAGDAAKARAEYEQFLAAWKDGDPAAAELAHAHQYLAGQATLASTR
jgi:Tfp pilus assembly protein PilF